MPQDIPDTLKRGCKKAKIAFGCMLRNGFVYHGLRHPFATSAGRAGFPRNVIKGHSTGSDMHARYDLIEAIDLMEGYFSQVLIKTLTKGAKPKGQAEGSQIKKPALTI
jgi:hypothetical protein